ncbi:restriction endonuclease [Escherichia coli]|uniref:restriction endonuclease n=1 Tax=Escherichia coli TaxID=562 RepID=UPI0011251704|nr:restriction endonuclease [Escherichia coli]
MRDLILQLSKSSIYSTKPICCRRDNHYPEHKLIPLSELFDVNYGLNLELNKLEKDSSGINFVSRTSKNNGVSARVKLKDGISPCQQLC